MGDIFINFTNHPSSTWSKEQIKQAQNYGEVIDIPFPAVPPAYSREEVEHLGTEYFDRIARLQPQAVLCQGEFTLSVYIIRRLKEEGITVLAACSERIAVTKGNEKTSIFKFSQFREYI